MSAKEISAVLAVLAKHYTQPGALEFANPYRTLVGVVLSARTRDEQVLQVLPALLKTFPTVHALSRAKEEGIYHLLQGIGMNKQKQRIFLCLQKRL